MPVITISREYGSGGKLIGQLLSKILNIPFYDSQILEESANKINLDLEKIKKYDESIKTTFEEIFSNSIFISNDATFENLPIKDKLFIVQSDIIRDVAKSGNAIIIGRCADYVLKDYDNVVNVFIHLNKKERITNIMERDNLSREESIKKIAKIDKQRDAYYTYYSHENWGNAQNYHLCIDSCIGIEKVAKLIKSYVEL